MTEKDKMLNEQLYNASDMELSKDRARARRLTSQYNALMASADDAALGECFGILKNLFGSMGHNCHIEPIFRCDYGFNINVGDNFYANYDCIILDVAQVNIGHNVMFGPRVCVYTAGHPIDPETRISMLEFGRSISIGDNVWIGGNAVILPGVKIGKNTVIGAGSVVSEDIPEGAMAVGNPCRVLREVRGCLD